MGIKLNTTSGGSSSINPIDGISTATLNVPNNSGTILVGPDVAYPVIKPTLNLDFANSRQLDTRITFSRSYAGTYYDGKTVALAEQNLVTYSSFLAGAGGWTTTGITPTQTAGIAPDGTNTLNSITEDTSTGGHGLYKTITGATSSFYTASIYAQANTRSYVTVQIATDTTSNRYSITVNLSTGAFVSDQIVGAPTRMSYSIQAVGSMYRISVTSFNTSGSVSIIVAMTDSANPTYSLASPSYTGNGTSSIYLWGAQLEQRSQVTAYTPTTASAITNYIPQLMTAAVNVPRFDYDIRPTLNGTGSVSGSTITLTTFADGSTASGDSGAYKGNITIAGTSYPIVSCYNKVITVTGTPTTGTQIFSLTNPNVGQPLGLLIEESRTNSVQYSQDFRNTADAGSARLWTYGNITLGYNTTIAPDGTLTANTMVASASTATTYIQQSFTSSARAYTFSAYVKSAGVQYIQLLWSSAQSTNYANFDIVQGTVGTNTATLATITPVGNSWYRVAITSTLATSAGALNIYMVSSSSDARAATYTGNGYSGIRIWGAQLDDSASSASFATSYIATTTPVTRGADQASMTGTNFSSWFNKNQGTFYCEGDVIAIPMPVSSILIGFDSSVSKRVLYIPPSTNTLATYDGIASALPSTTSLSANKIIKATLSYTQTTRVICAMAEQPQSGSTIPSFSASSTLNIGGDAPYPLNGHIKKISYYPVALTSTELQALTTV